MQERHRLPSKIFGNILYQMTIYCSFEEFKRLRIVLVSDDFLQFHQLFLIKGNAGFRYL